MNQFKLEIDLFWPQLQILHSDLSIGCNLFQGLSRLYFIPTVFLKQEFDSTDLKFWFSYATMNVWVQIWVQDAMCYNNTIKLEWYIYVMCDFSLYNVWFMNCCNAGLAMQHQNSAECNWFSHERCQVQCL